MKDSRDRLVHVLLDEVVARVEPSARATRSMRRVAAAAALTAAAVIGFLVWFFGEGEAAKNVRSTGGDEEVAIETPRDVISVPAAKPPTLDGRLADGEWERAVTLPLGDRGRVHLVQADGVLYLALEGPSFGLGSVILESAGAIDVLHASATLGTARYGVENGDVGGPWSLQEPFSFRPASDAFFREEGWNASISRGASRVIEYAIAPSRLSVNSGKTSRIAAILATFTSTGRVDHYWPRPAEESFEDGDLLMGRTPSEIDFTPLHFADITLD